MSVHHCLFIYHEWQWLIDVLFPLVSRQCIRSCQWVKSVKKRKKFESLEMCPCIRWEYANSFYKELKYSAKRLCTFCNVSWNLPLISYFCDEMRRPTPLIKLSSCFRRKILDIMRWSTSWICLVPVVVWLNMSMRCFFES